MNLHRLVNTSIALSIVLSCAAAAPAWADRDNREAGPGRHESGPSRSQAGPARGPSGYVLDDRYRHGRYYPPHGHVVQVLPPDRRIITFRGAPYYFHGGVWYRPSGPRFVVVAPPIGIFVPVLPPFYTTIWVGGIPYYYADNVYYRPHDNGYVVTEPPPESQITEQPASPSQLFAYPKNGQSEQQQANDRYECHRWAVTQSGFDPTQPSASASESQIASKRADYQRAIKACLEARGYSVQ